MYEAMYEHDTFYPQNAASQGTCPNSLLFCCFHFKLTFESIKELGGASIRIIDTFYNQRFKKFLYYHWIQKLVHISYKIITPNRGKSQLIHMNHILQFIITACTNEIHINLKWRGFSYFHVFITSITKLKSYVF